MVGQRIGIYRLLRPLGEGGMGAVYEAVDDKTSHHVAIKILHPEYARQPEFVKRFFNEARAVSKISHPGLVHISETGKTLDGVAFLVMEYLQGETLSARLARSGRRLPETAVLPLLRQLALAVAAAHAHGIVHRDLKPSNVMLVADPTVPGGERVKLLDFGIAKIDRQDTTSAVRTRTGAVMGTALYISPEQCLGAAQVDGKADVYSFGIIFFEMLAGSPPFIAELDLALLNMHISKPAPSVLDVAPHVSKPVAKLIKSLLSKSPDERPEMQEVAAELQRLSELTGQLSGGSAGSPRSTATILSSRLSRRTLTLLRQSRTGMISAAALMLSLACGLYWLMLVRRTSNKNMQTEAQRPALQQIPEKVQKPQEKHFCHLTTIPAGAIVYSSSNSNPLGLTPWRGEVQNLNNRIYLILRKKGYRDRRISFDCTQNSQREEVLDPESTIPPAKVKSDSKAAAGSNERSRVKSKQLTERDVNHYDSRRIID